VSDTPPLFGQVPVRAQLLRDVSMGPQQPVIPAGTLGMAKLVYPDSGLLVFVDDEGRRAIVSTSILVAVAVPR
jgi:hypothetical protein